MKSLLNQFSLAILFALVGICMSGCHLRPNFGPPGTIGAQREQALLHDPYPDNDLGPAVSGTRPSGYERPFAETRQLQGPFSRNNNRGAQFVPQFGF